jgi:hypothetical protein
MKKLIIIASVILVGCTKDYKCTSTTSDGGTGTINFRGTKEEMKQYEEDGTYTYGTFSILTECK